MHQGFDRGTPDFALCGAESPRGKLMDVVVVAAPRLYREALAQRLSEAPGIEVVGSAPTVPACLETLPGATPGVVVVELEAHAWCDALRALATRAPEAKVVAVTRSTDEGEVLACLEAGVAACVSRDDSPETVVETIESVARGELPCSPRVAALLAQRLHALAASHNGRAQNVDLTPREREIVALIDEGLRDKEIARRLFIQHRTVKNHVHNILEKLHVKTRGEAAALVRRASGEAALSPPARRGE